MNDKKQKFHNILEQFNGMRKIEAYDLMHKLETIFFYSPNHIDSKKIEDIVTSGIDNDHEIDPFHFTILPNGNFCEFVGANNWIHIYKEQKKGLGRFMLFDTYYFKTKYAPLELTKLTKKNLLKSLKDTPEEIEILNFLKKNHLTQKNLITNKLILVELMEL